MIMRDENGEKRRVRNRRYIDRRYIKLKQKLPFKDWLNMVKYNVANGKVFNQTTSVENSKETVGEL